MTCLSGWLCSVSFCQNWVMSSCINGLLQKGKSIYGDVEWLLRPDKGSYGWSSGVCPLWCQLWHIRVWKELEHIHRTSCSYRVFGVGYFCSVHNVVIPWSISVVHYVISNSLNCQFQKASISVSNVGASQGNIGRIFVVWQPHLAHWREFEMVGTVNYPNEMLLFCLSKVVSSVQL